MKALHSTSDLSFLNVINHALYAENLRETKTLISTGVTFKIHTGTTFEILFDYVLDAVYFQPNHIISIPQVAGLVVNNSKGRFFDKYYYDRLIWKVWESKLETISTGETELINANYEHKFIVVDEDNNEHQFPISYQYPKEIYNGATSFQII